MLDGKESAQLEKEFEKKRLRAEQNAIMKERSRPSAEKEFTGRSTKASSTAMKVGGQFALGAIRGLAKVAFRKGVRHPDTLIDPKARSLYLPSNPQISPIGRMIHNPMELYFGRSMAKVPEEAKVVLAAYKRGYTTEDEIEIATGLPRWQIKRGLRYLVTRRIITTLED